MQELRERVVEMIRSMSLPIEQDDLFSGFYSEKIGAFVVQESLHWDFKQAFPSNMKDDYFGGILRLVCAFYNMYGGVIVFGVDDESRAPGVNKVSVDIESFNAAARLKLSVGVECIHRRYTLRGNDGTDLPVDVVLIPKRPAGIAPVRFKASIAKYRMGVIWGRFGHQVLEVPATDLPLLYMSRDDYGVNPSHSHRQYAIHKSLPPSPATARHFIGRADLMDALWEWLINADAPRLFICGPGGSGKSTLAHEFARGVAHSGKYILTSNGIALDFVIYLSAKETELNPLNAQIQGFEAKDFSNADEMISKILVHSGFQSLIDIAELSTQEKWGRLRELLDSFHGLIVLDDIDALTRRGIDAGMEKLFQISVRAKCGAKILYTLRNVPSLAAGNAVEVPGLKYSEEYLPFVESYAKQLGIQQPDSSFVASKLDEASGRFPLVIETILALRRTCSDFNQALSLYETHKGEQARQYMFQREYDRLPIGDDRPKLLLAALIEFESGLAFNELLSILNCSAEQLSDSIALVDEIFLRRSADGAKFELQPVAQKFVEDRSKSLQRAAQLAARVHWFKSEHAPETPALGSLRREVETLLNRRFFNDALKSMLNPDLSPMVTEHPRYKAILGYIQSIQSPPNFSDARDAYQAAWNSGHKDVSMLRDWFYMELDAKTNMQQALKVCDMVISDGVFSPAAKSEFCSKKGQAHRSIAKMLYATNPNETLRNFRLGIECYLQAMHIDDDASLPGRKTPEWLYSIFNEYCGAIVEFRTEGDMIELFKGIQRKKINLDGMCGQIIRFFTYLLQNMKGADLYRIHAFLKTVQKEAQRAVYRNEQVKSIFVDDLTNIARSYEKKLSEA